MFVQSHDGAVHLLPALPDVWERGVIKGIRCRGGFLLEEMKWEKGQMQTATICSTIGGTLRIRTGSPLYLNGEKLEPVEQAPCNNPLLQPQPIRKPLIAANAERNIRFPPGLWIIKCKGEYDVFSFFLLCNIPQADLVPQIITENKKYVPKNKYSTKDFSH